jgi:hypothetical protein
MVEFSYNDFLKIGDADGLETAQPAADTGSGEDLIVSDLQSRLDEGLLFNRHDSQTSKL